MMEEGNFDTYRLAAKYLLEKLASSDNPLAHPEIGIICGSGLSELSDCMTETTSVCYTDIPGFPSHTTVQGHKNSCVLGMLNNVPAICFRGRFHFYEGHDMNTVALPVRTMRAMGVKLVFVTNAAGGLNSSYQVGDIVCIMDHVALPMLAGRNPLIGPNDPELGPRFPPTSNAYDPLLQALVLDSAKRLGLEHKLKTNGVYCYVAGPMYESKAECRFLKSLGGDAVGMATVPEIVAAHHSGMKILCLSVITNKVIIEGDEGPAASHQEVLDAVNKCAQQIQSLIVDIITNSRQYVCALPSLNILTPRMKK